MYDAIIIGAGIGGLVCGCYLAKAGMKVLICEQHFKPGGYCTSFKRKGFTFDAAAHSFGGYRKDGIVRKVFTELGIDNQLRIKRYNPSDTIITPDYKISFWSDLDKTIRDFQKVFPDENDGITNFFYFLINPDPTYSIRIRNWTFKNLLDQYFKDEKLKAILSFPLFGNGGLPPSLMSAFTGTQIFAEFLLDGGYYPRGGMQALPDSLAARFKEFGGELRLSCLVKRIRVKDNNIIGVDLERDGFIPSKYVISNCDTRQTFIRLLRSKIDDRNVLNKIKKMTPSLSMFILYIGVDKAIKKLPKAGINIWLLPNYNLDDIYLSARKGDVEYIVMVRVLPDDKSVMAFANTSFKNKNYWNANKEEQIESSIRKIEKYAIPELSKHVIYKDAATPYTLHRYTLNYKGASYGWASIPSQFGDSNLKKPSFIQNLYFSSQWTTLGSGIAGVTYTGHNTAKFIIKKKCKREILYSFR